MIAEVPPTIRQAVLLIGALALSLSNVACGQDRAKRIRNSDVVLTVNTDGSLEVTERLSIKFTGRWGKIERDLWLRPTTAGGHPEIVVSHISATDAEGQRLRVEAYRGNRHRGGGSSNLNVDIWITPYALNEDRTVIIRYHITNAIRFDELYWRVNDAGNPIGKAHVAVVLPTGVVPTRAVVYTYESNNEYPIIGIHPAAKIAADAKIEINGNSVSIGLPHASSRFEVMTLAMGWPSGHIAAASSR